MGTNVASISSAASSRIHETQVEPPLPRETAAAKPGAPNALVLRDGVDAPEPPPIGAGARDAGGPPAELAFLRLPNIAEIVNDAIKRPRRGFAPGLGNSPAVGEVPKRGFGDDIRNLAGGGDKPKLDFGAGIRNSPAVGEVPERGFGDDIRNLAGGGDKPKGFGPGIRNSPAIGEVPKPSVGEAIRNLPDFADVPPLRG